MRNEIPGGGATAVVYGNYPDEAEMKQIYEMLQAAPFKGASVRIMPDHHAGMGCVIGFTCPIDMNDPKIIPNVIGVDIGCGVQGVRLPDHVNLSREEHFAAFDRHLRQGAIPCGFENRAEVHPELEMLFTHFIDPTGWVEFESRINDLIGKINTDPSKVWKSCGSLGGGNHFVEVGRGELVIASPEPVDKNAPPAERWMIVHSGSRGFGLKVANYHQQKAKDGAHPFGDLSWLEGEAALEYLRDMKLAQKFALLSRHVMLYEQLGAFKMRLHEKLALERILSVHNFISENDNIIRKGAISATKGETCIIPWNMKDGIVIGKGKGNTEWNNSAPHGAGRTMSRAKAKKTLSMATFKKEMEDAGVWSSCVCKETLDEAPGAYKPSVEVETDVAETLEIITRLKPIYNFKASKEER